MKTKFFPYLLAGYPDWSLFEKLFDLTCLYADTIEVGIPFTDPVADGPVIRQAATRVLRNGFSIDRLFVFLESRQKKPPVAMMTYANPVLAVGQTRFFEKCLRSGVRYLILPDIPLEESEEWRIQSKIFDLSWISFVSLVTRGERLKRIAESAEGFVYLVSLTGITGADIAAQDLVCEKIQQLRQYTNVPVALGFGVKSLADAAPFIGWVDAFIVGSKIIELAGTSLQAVESFYQEFILGLKESK